MKKLLASTLMFMFAWSFIAMAQSPSPSASPISTVAPTIVAPGVVSTGIMGWITAHGGFQAAVLLLVGAAFSILSAIRTLVSSLDGVAPGAAIPSGMVGLTTLNKVCVILGKIIDFVQGNVQH